LITTIIIKTGTKIKPFSRGNEMNFKKIKNKGSFRFTFVIKKLFCTKKTKQYA